MPVATLALALLLLAVAVARGGTAYPRWAALMLNPASLAAVGAAAPFLFPQPMRALLEGAGFNLGWLVVYALSTVLLWRSAAA